MFAFIITVIIVTASGALAPGPLFFINIAYGTKFGAKSGLAFSVGHAIFELILIMFLALTLQTVVNEPLIKIVIGVVGGTALLIFGFLQIRGAVTSKSTFLSKRVLQSKNLLLLGIIFTGLNPYFIIWWFTIGITLIVNALTLASFAGVLIMYALHVWMDYVCLTVTAYLAKKGITLIGSKGYRITLIVFGLILIFYGLYFIAPTVLTYLS